MSSLTRKKNDNPFSSFPAWQETEKKEEVGVFVNCQYMPESDASPLHPSLSFASLLHLRHFRDQVFFFFVVLGASCFRCSSGDTRRLEIAIFFFFFFCGCIAIKNVDRSLSYWPTKQQVGISFFPKIIAYPSKTITP